MEEQAIVPEVLQDKAIELGLSFSDSAYPIGIFPSQIRYETSLLKSTSVKAFLLTISHRQCWWLSL